ncbi:DUF6278 family protein [Armatimonas sp.]|uniref:DUF6278 family protein n=1 Tax=Armatimonas sp. TaxID=1872638 RepID=UPI0037526D60
MTLTADNVGLYAETLVRQAVTAGYSLDYSAESLTTLDTLLAGSDPLYDLSSETQRSLVIFYVGCYLGEVMVRTLGGQWRLSDPWAESCVLIARAQAGIEIRPFEKLSRRLLEGEDGNRLAAYYQGIMELLAHGSVLRY